MTLLARTISNLKGTLIMVREGRVVEARVLARCCFENQFWIGGLASDGQAFRSAMLHDEMKKRQTRGEMLFKLNSEMEDDVEQKLRKWLREHKQWNDSKTLSPKQVAMKTDIGRSYIFYDQLSSDAAHPTVNALNRYIVPADDDGIRSIDMNPVPSDEELAYTLNIASLAVMGVLIGANQVLGDTPGGAALNALADEYKALTEQTGDARRDRTGTTEEKESGDPTQEEAKAEGTTEKPRPAVLEYWEEVQHDPLTYPPDNFSGMTIDEAVDAIKKWFYENFEDPAQSTPYDSGEGGYQYIWGGPYQTRDIIENVFADSASEELIRAAVQSLERVSSEWVPHSQRLQPPEDLPLPPAEDLDPGALHAQLLDRIRAIEEALGRVPELPAGMGHNQPPEPLEPEPLDAKDRQEIVAALETLKAQPADPTDKGATASAAVAQVEAKRSKLLQWLAQQGEVFTTEAVKEAGKGFGKWAPRVFWLWLLDKIFDFSQAAHKWLSVLQLPF